MAQVRKATLEDLPRLQAMGARFMLETPYGEWMQNSPKRIEELVEPMLAGAGIVLVAEEQQQIVGMVAALAYADPFTGPTCDEVAWWVEPEHRNGLTGPRLLRALENWSRQKGLRLLKMIAPTAAPEVADFYSRSGFTALQTTYVKRLS